MSKKAGGRLLIVVPTVLEMQNGELRLDSDFGNNLEAYLGAFDTVIVACPLNEGLYQFPSTRRVDSIEGSERLEIVVQPLPYREDRYLLHRRRVRRTLQHEIDRADFVLVTPHAVFDWATLAAELCRRSGRKYNMESDWNLPAVMQSELDKMPRGLRKLRKALWFKLYLPQYRRLLRNSTLSLVQGEDVFDDYQHMAPNAHSVLNIQITDRDRIDDDELMAKRHDALRGDPLRIVYAGRCIAMKGPLHWLDVLAGLEARGVPFRATWFGDGDMLNELRRARTAKGLEDRLALPGRCDRAVVLDEMSASDVFVFCHLEKESPRCLVEALAVGTPIVGFGTEYPRSLVREHGGGVFVDERDVDGLVETLAELHDDRARLSSLMLSAADSGRALDRHVAIDRRIRLMRENLTR